MSTLNIHELLPHAGNMVLIDELVTLTEEAIECKARSHQLADNPLRHAGRLPIEAGIEYCAQAMALHSALESGSTGGPREGYLAVLKRLQWADLPDMAELEGDIAIFAQRLSSLTDSSQYQFEIRHRQRSILSGQALVVLAQSAG